MAVLWKHLEKVASPCLIPDTGNPPEIHDPSLTDQLCCPICTFLLNGPVQLSCGAIICLPCCKSWVNHRPSGSMATCPCCYDHLFNSSEVHSPPPLIASLMEGLLVHCGRGCGRVVRLASYRKHLDSRCRSHYDMDIHSPSRMTIKDVLSKPASTPASAVEKKVAEHLVKKMLDESPDTKVVKIPTRGQASTYYSHYNT